MRISAALAAIEYVKNTLSGLGNCAKSCLINAFHLPVAPLAALDHSQKKKKVSTETNFSVDVTSPDSGSLTAS